MVRQFIAIILISLIPFFSHAQTVENFKLPNDYIGTLDKILLDMGSDLNIRFVFDLDYLKNYKTSLMMDNEKTVGGVLRMIRNSWDMTTLVGQDGFIYIAKDKEHLNLLMQGKEEEKNVTVVTRKALKPVKRNFLLSGDIVNSDNGERIPFATIMVQGTTNGVLSDQIGHFVLENVPADTSVIVISYIGYHGKEIGLEPKRENTPLHIEIKQQSVGISEVFIYGRKDDKALQQATLEQKIKMSPIALKVLPNLGEKDIMRGFQLMPGVSAANEGSAGMYVRGGTPDQNLIIYDGFTVYNVDHLFGFYSAFNSNAIKDVQLYKGGFESKYGGRLSSVTEITGKDGNSKKASMGAEVSLLSMNAYVEIPYKDRLTSMFAFRRSYQGYLYDKISGMNQSASSSQKLLRFGTGNAQANSYFYDFNGKITYNATKNDIVTFSIFNGTDYLDNSPEFGKREGGGGGHPGGGGRMPAIENISMENSDFTRYGNIGSSLKWTRKLSEKLSSYSLISFSDFYSTRDQRRSISFVKDGVAGSMKSGILEDNNLIDASFKNDWKYSFNGKNTLEFGGYGTYYDIAYTYSQNDTIKVLDKLIKSTLVGFYAQDKISLYNDLIAITAGLRANYFGATGRIYPEPRLKASFQITPKISVNAATGLFYQFANRVVREDIMSGNRDFWLLSNGKEIPVSSSAHLNLGLNYELPDYLFSVEGYYKRNQNVTEYSMRYRSVPQPGSNVQSTEQFFNGNGYSVGMEFLAQKKAGKFNGWICYSLGEVKNRFPAISDNYSYANHDVTNEVKVVGIYKYGNFDFSASWIFATGRPYTAPLGGYTLKLIDGITGSYYAVSDKNSFRLPDYHRLDLAASYRFKLFRQRERKNTLSFSVFNLYNRNNVSSKQFQILDNVILDSNISYLGITPNVSLSINF